MVIPLCGYHASVAHTALGYQTTTTTTTTMPDNKSKSKPQASPKAQSDSKPKRTSGEMRTEYVAMNAHLLMFTRPSTPRPMFGAVEPPLGYEPRTLFSNDKAGQAAVQQYRLMERKGFRVTKDLGCLIPEEHYSTAKQGASLKGHQRSVEFFAGFRPSGPEPGVEPLRNEYGWPSALEISHLCHRRSCARIDHLVVEEKWRNQKRNYCGASGQCDCGNVTKCLRRYQMDSVTEQPEYFTTGAQVMEKLAEAKDLPVFEIVPSSHYVKRDEEGARRKAATALKNANAATRKRAGELLAQQTARKQARLQGPLSSIKAGMHVGSASSPEELD